MTIVQKCKVSISILLSQIFIPKYHYQFLKSDISASLYVVHTERQFGVSIPVLQCSILDSCMDAVSFPCSLLGMSCDEQHLETELKCIKVGF